MGLHQKWYRWPNFYAAPRRWSEIVPMVGVFVPLEPIKDSGVMFNSFLSISIYLKILRKMVDYIQISYSMGVYNLSALKFKTLTSGPQKKPIGKFRPIYFFLDPENLSGSFKI